MSLSSALLLDPYPMDLHIAIRTDHQRGTGTGSDPISGGVRFGPQIAVSLSRTLFEVQGNTGSIEHHFSAGDLVQISEVSGPAANIWNGIFCLYDVQATTFKFALGKAPTADPVGNPKVALAISGFDEALRNAPPNMRINIGPGEYLTRGFAPGWDRGFTPKSAQKIVGAGFDVTTIKLLGAGVVMDENDERHFHAIGMPIEPSGSFAITPLKHFEVCDLTIDCNLDGQPLLGQRNYSPVACGAIRVIGEHCRVRNVKVINWGTKSLEQGCFVISMIQASAQPTSAGPNGQPIITSTKDNIIEDCIAVQPSKESAREVTVLHIGGLKNAQNHAQAFGRACVIRKNFIDGTLYTTFDPSPTTYEPLRVPYPFPSPFIVNASGTGISGTIGTFQGKRPHFRNSLDLGRYVRLHNPVNPDSRWNGYFPILTRDDDNQITVNLQLSKGTNDDSNMVVLGFEIRGIAISSGARVIIEQNQMHNCWIGGPYQGLLDDGAAFDSNVSPTLSREERLDALNSLCIQSAIVRDNHYRAVAVGPYFNMGGMTNAVAITNLDYDPATGVATATTAANHHLWLNARVKVESATGYEGIHEITAVTNTTFNFQLATGLNLAAVTIGTYRIVSGVDFLVIENNQIGLLDLDETAFGIKTYPLATTPSAQTYRACGIIVGDNNLPGLFAHREAYIRNNKINYVDNQVLPTFYGAGLPIGMAMQLAGIKHLHVTHNVIELNPAGRIRTFHCGKVHAFNNRKFNGEIVPVTNWESMSWYDEPETILEDAFLLKFLLRRHG